MKLKLTREPGTGAPAATSCVRNPRASSAWQRNLVLGAMRIIALTLTVLVSLSAKGEDFVLTSMVRLIASPDLYSQRAVVVHGYLKDQGKVYLYATKESANINDLASSVLVANLTSGESDIGRRCGGHYARVTGRIMLRRDFEGYAGDLGFYELTEIKSVDIGLESGDEHQCYKSE